MAAPQMPLLSVAPTEDGVWSVNERGPSRAAIAYASPEPAAQPPEVP